MSQDESLRGVINSYLVNVIVFHHEIRALDWVVKGWRNDALCPMDKVHFYIKTQIEEDFARLCLGSQQEYKARQPSNSRIFLSSNSRRLGVLNVRTWPILRQLIMTH